MLMATPHRKRQMGLTIRFESLAVHSPDRGAVVIHLSSVENGPSGGLGLRLGSLDPGDAGAAIDADRHLSVERDAADHAVLIAIIVHGIVLRGTIVPDRDVALPPAPAHGVFGRGDMRLEQIEQLLAVVFRHPEEALYEIAEHERPLAGLRMDPNHGMLGLIDRAGEDLVEMLSIGFAGALLHRIVIGVAVDRPELVG